MLFRRNSLLTSSVNSIKSKLPILTKVSSSVLIGGLANFDGIAQHPSRNLGADLYHRYNIKKMGKIPKALTITAGAAAAVAAAWAGFKLAEKADDLAEQQTAVKRGAQPGQRMGTFYCAECGLKWTSPFAWIGEHQKCKKCRNWIEPLEMTSLDNEFIIKTPHMPERCSRCQKYARPCYIPLNDASG